MITITVADGVAEKELLNSLRQRSGETDKKVTASVTEILDNVKSRGDEAVREYTMKFDGRCPERMEVTRAQMEEAVAEADPRFVEALRNAMENIREFHSRQKQQSFIDAKSNGVMMGQRIRGLKRVGLYVPSAVRFSWLTGGRSGREYTSTKKLRSFENFTLWLPFSGVRSSNPLPPNPMRQ